MDCELDMFFFLHVRNGNVARSVLRLVGIWCSFLSAYEYDLLTWYLLLSTVLVFVELSSDELRVVTVVAVLFIRYISYICIYIYIYIHTHT